MNYSQLFLKLFFDGQNQFIDFLGCQVSDAFFSDGNQLDILSWIVDNLHKCSSEQSCSLNDCDVFLEVFL